MIVPTLISILSKSFKLIMRVKLIKNAKSVKSCSSASISKRRRRRRSNISLTRMTNAARFANASGMPFLFILSKIFHHMEQNENLPNGQTKSQVSRRKFIRNTAIVGGSFFIVPRHVLGRGYIAPSDKLNIAGIGVGGKGEGDLAEFAKSPNVNI